VHIFSIYFVKKHFYLSIFAELINYHNISNL